VDEPRNALIYQGEPAQWERMLTLIRQMDKAPRQVMIEVTIAEITLSNTTDVGINWFALHGFGRFNGKIWSGPGAGGTDSATVGSGLTWLLNDAAGQNRAVLKAMAQDSRVNILSTPRLMVKSGSEASMDVGDEIPTVSMTTTSGQQSGGSTNLLQSIQYRKTGVLLKIKPTVYSDNRVDIDLSQEVSKASDDAPSQSTAASAASPTIRNRVLTTSLTLKDGETIIMGGLMSSDNSDGNSGVPLVKDIPLLGNLFKSRKKVTEKKELVLVIVPYIVENDEHAAAVSQAIMDRAEFLELEQFPKRTPANPETQTSSPRP
jgi:general secretion pathway protein D